jgi:hypothetical protein
MMARVSQAPQYLGSAAARTSRHAHREVSVPLAGRQAVIVNLFNKNKVRALSLYHLESVHLS